MVRRIVGLTERRRAGRDHVCCRLYAYRVASFARISRALSMNLVSVGDFASADGQTGS